MPSTIETGGKNADKGLGQSSNTKAALCDAMCSENAEVHIVPMMASERERISRAFSSFNT